MNRMTPILLALAFAATGVACGKKEPPATPAPVAAPVVLLTAPTGNETEAWKAYLKQELTPFIDKRYRRPYIYFIPMVDETAADKDALVRIAEASSAAYYDASDAATIDNVLTSVLSNF